MPSHFRPFAILLSSLLVVPSVPAAAAIQVSSQRISGVPAGGNALIKASVPAGTTVSSARVYFNADGKKPEYYLEMVRGDGGSFWATLPIPKSETKAVQYRVVFRDAEGKESAAPNELVPVTGDANKAASEAEQRYAKNLVIGVTEATAPLLPEGFECEGVVSSINVQGELKPNELCRVVVIPPAVWVGAGTVAAAAGAVIISNSGDGEKKPVSPSRPGPTPR